MCRGRGFGLFFSCFYIPLLIDILSALYCRDSYLSVSDRKCHLVFLLRRVPTVVNCTSDPLILALLM